MVALRLAFPQMRKSTPKLAPVDPLATINIPELVQELDQEVDALYKELHSETKKLHDNHAALMDRLFPPVPYYVPSSQIPEEVAALTEATVVGSLEELDIERYVEVGDRAVWMVSSFKEGNGLEQLRDGDLTTYWQSDNVAPHKITLEFSSKMPLKYFCFYLDASTDESYTPEKVELRVGPTLSGLRTLATVELKEPCGWVVIPLCEGDDPRLPVGAYIVQLAILSSYQNVDVSTSSGRLAALLGAQQLRLR